MKKIISILLCFVFCFGIITQVIVNSSAVVGTATIVTVLVAVVASLGIYVNASTLTDITQDWIADGVGYEICDGIVASETHKLAIPYTVYTAVKLWLYEKLGIIDGEYTTPSNIPAGVSFPAVNGINCIAVDSFDLVTKDLLGEINASAYCPRLEGGISYGLAPYTKQIINNDKIEVYYYKPENSKLWKVKLLNKVTGEDLIATTTKTENINNANWNNDQEYYKGYQPVVTIDSNMKWSMRFYALYHPHGTLYPSYGMQVWYTMNWQSNKRNGNYENIFIDANGDARAGVNGGYNVKLTDDKDYVTVENYIADFVLEGVDTALPAPAITLDDTDTLIIPDNIADTLIDVNGNVITGTQDITDQLTDIQTLIETQVAELDVPDTVDLGTSNSKFKMPIDLLLTKFPFSLPNDLYKLITALKAEPTPLSFVIPIEFELFGFVADYDIAIDLGDGVTDISPAITVVKWFIGISWTFGLIMITRKIMM